MIHPLFLDPEARFAEALGYQLVERRDDRAFLLKKSKGIFTRWVLLCDRWDSAESFLPKKFRVNDEWVWHSFSQVEPPQVPGFHLSKDGERLFPLETARINLELSLEELRSSLSATARNLVSKNEREARTVVVFEDVSEQLHSVLVELESSLRERKLNPVSAKQIETWVKKKNAIVVHVDRGQHDSSHTAVIFFKNQYAQLVYQSSSGRDSSGGAHFLQWACISALRERRYRFYDLGGINERLVGITSFKSMFGGERIRLGSEYLRTGALLKLVYFGLKRFEKQR